MIKSPESSRIGRIEEPVWTVSLAPTFLDFAEVGYGAEEFSAPSLKPLWNEAPEPLERYPVYSETAPEVNSRHRWGVRFEKFEYMQSAKGKEEEELYDLQSDPGQMEELAPLHPEDVGHGRALLNEYHEKNMELKEFHRFESKETLTLPPEEIERLRKLGYL